MLTARTRIAAMLSILLALVVTLNTGVAIARANQAWPDGDTSEAGVRTIGFHAGVTVGYGEKCRIAGELFIPDGVDAAHPAPAVLNTHGWGGRHTDDHALQVYLARQGYVTIGFDALGHGDSSCELGLDTPDWDGVAVTQLVTMLGGGTGISFADKEMTTSLPAIDFVQTDRTDRFGEPKQSDPRVGMVGASYGGAMQFSAASQDTRIDALVPISTFNDLEQALLPNYDDGAEPAPGIAKTTWGLGLLAVGQLSMLSNFQADPYRPLLCAQWRHFDCAEVARSTVDGVGSARLRSMYRAASPANYLDKVSAPTLLIQGSNDTLFPLNQAEASYRALSAHGTPVKLVWGRSGHNGQDKREIDTAAPSPEQYFIARASAWFDRYLKDKDVDTGPEFSYYRDWADDGTSPIAASYADANSVDVGVPEALQLGTQGSLAPERRTDGWGAQTFLTGVAGLPTSIRKVDLPLDQGLDGVYPDLSLPGTFAKFTTEPLPTGRSVVGAPTLQVKIAADAEQWRADPHNIAAKPNLFLKLYDVAPDGSRAQVHGVASPVRVQDPRESVTVKLDSVVHRFETGHRIELEVAGGDTNYRGQLLASMVTIDGARAGQALTLPVVPD